MYVIIIINSLLGYAEGRPGEANIVIVGLDYLWDPSLQEGHKLEW
jgi:hypothetical protein